MALALIYGRHPVAEALAAGEALDEIYILDKASKQGPLADIAGQARARSIPLRFVPRPALDRIMREQGFGSTSSTSSGRKDGAGRSARGRKGRGASGGGSHNHQGVIARYAGFAYADLNEILARALKADEPAFILVLDVIQDVQNLGSLIRSAEAVGAHGVLIADRGAASVTPAVRKASAGAVAHMAIARLDLVEALDRLKARGVMICGLDASGDRAPWECDLKVPLACVVGSEGRGQRDVIARRCDQLISLPMRGQLGSLNASVAGSILLYEIQRQRMG